VRVTEVIDSEIVDQQFHLAEEQAKSGI